MFFVIIYQCISIEKNTLFVLGQLPAVQLREGDAQFWSGQQSKIFSVTGIDDVDFSDLVEHIL